MKPNLYLEYPDRLALIRKLVDYFERNGVFLCSSWSYRNECSGHVGHVSSRISSQFAQKSYLYISHWWCAWSLNIPCVAQANLGNAFSVWSTQLVFHSCAPDGEKRYGKNIRCRSIHQLRCDQIIISYAC